MNEKRNTELFLFIQIILSIISFHFKFKLYSEIFLISFLSFIKFISISISQINQIFRTNCIFKPSKMLISSVQTFTQLPTHRLIKVRQSENRGCRSTLRIDVR